MIFENPIFTEMLLPFLLIFVVVFAILQKSKILGDKKKQIDALVSLVIGLITITVPVARNFMVALMPWLAVGVGVILVFFILYGFVAGDLSGDGMPKGLKVTFGILSGVFVVGIVLYLTGLYKDIFGAFTGGIDSSWIINAIIIIVIIAAVAWVVVGEKKDDKKKDK